MIGNRFTKLSRARRTKRRQETLLNTEINRYYDRERNTSESKRYGGRKIVGERKRLERRRRVCVGYTPNTV